MVSINKLQPILSHICDTCSLLSVNFSDLSYRSETGVSSCILSEAADILSLVVEQLKRHSDSEGVVTAGCGLLDTLTEAGMLYLYTCSQQFWFMREGEDR